jgi:hypothetical protein
MGCAALHAEESAQYGFWPATTKLFIQQTKSIGVARIANSIFK